ncbi:MULTISPECIES: hypothetical protein [unclassified Streptomyces]|uniref:hypothetical protein n=1 Tax=unclassified Streptomyces TaxID=2593676 RepID=UPI002DDC8E9C|nr:hypothetical protein [Streptomyces sp. NBC_01750]WSB05124.1 hypothetical protein OIE54_41555 [Streptomyces sp. NBC_01794]WSD30544.1 hypothetical protein OG966_00225 [Streptomyces sp. NBC_01750]
MVKFSVGETTSVETTGNPLGFTPRFDFRDLQVIVAGYADPEEREQQLATTFGSMQWLWSENDHLRFDQGTRELCSATFFVPPESVPAEVCHRAPHGPPALPSGLRADTAKEFGLPQATVFCCTSEAAELRCFRDLGVLDGPLDARIGIAPDVDLLVQKGAVAGWSLTDPARYLTDGFADPEATPPSHTTRLRLAECLTLVSSPLVDQVMDQDTDAWRRLRATEHALRNQQDDRRRADVLHRIVSRLIDDYES